MEFALSLLVAFSFSGAGATYFSHKPGALMLLRVRGLFFITGGVSFLFFSGMLLSRIGGG